MRPSLRGRLALGLVLLSIARAAGLPVSLSMRQLEQDRARQEAMIRSAAATLAEDIDRHVANAVANVMVATAALHEADTALYAAKAAGRNRVSCYDEARPGVLEAGDSR